jgi:hypothetical protein
MKKLRLAGVAGLTALACTIPVATADAKQSTTGCPKKWAPTPTQAFPTPPEKDRNNNQLVCAKGPQGENGANPHFNVKDDHTDEPVNPVMWSTLALDLSDPLQDVFLVINNLDLFPGLYYLDPNPQDFEDDVPQG